MKKKQKLTLKSYLLSHIQVILIGFICIIVLISHTFYILQTKQYPEMDEQHYMDMAVQFYKLLQHPTGKTFVDMITFLPFRQPGYSFIILPFLLLFGIAHSYSLGLWVNGLLYITSICAVYLLGKEFFDKTISLIASVVFAGLGWSLFYLHFTYSETATTTFVILSLFFLKKSKVFTNRRYAILFGLAFGYGIFTRWVVPIFVAGAGAVTLVEFWYLAKKEKSKALKNIGILFLFVLPGLLPYIINNATFFGDYFKNQFFHGSLWQQLPISKRSHFSFQAAAYYFKIFEQLTIFIFLFFIAGLVLGIKHIKKYGFLIMSFLVAYAVFSFGTVIKDDRYIVPGYPIFALILVITIAHIKQLTFKWVAVGFIILISIGTFLGGSWGIGPMGKKGLASALLPMPVGHPRYVHFTSIVWPPTKEFSNADVLMDTIDIDSRRRQIVNPLTTLFFSYHPVINAIYAINTYEREQKLAFEDLMRPVTDPDEATAYVSDLLKHTNYLVIKKGGLTSDYYFPKTNYEYIDAINAVMPQYGNGVLENFDLIKKIFVPKDGSYLYVYRRRNDATFENMDVFMENLNIYLKTNAGMAIAL